MSALIIYTTAVNMWTRASRDVLERVTYIQPRWQGSVSPTAASRGSGVQEYFQSVSSSLSHRGGTSTATGRQMFR